MDPHRRRERRDAARHRLDHREPEPLGLGGHDHRVGRVDPERHLGGRDAAHGQQRRPGGGLLRAVEALQGPRRVVREEQVAPAGVEPEALPCLCARDRAEALEVDPHREHRHAPRGARAGQLAAELARDGGGERRQRQDRPREAVRARVEQVVAVERHDHGPESRGDRRPRREAEVRVDDVEPRPPVPPAQLAGGAAGSSGGRAGTRTARRRRRPAAAAPRPGRARTSRAPAAPRRVHVRDHEGAHGAPKVDTPL